MPDSLYSHDLVSRDFYLFPPVKEKCERIQLADEDQFFDCPSEILRGSDLEKLTTVFQAWVHRIQEISEDNGDYVR
jgi:hypothetical protein